jgi:hypothetical protein
MISVGMTMQAAITTGRQGCAMRSRSQYQYTGITQTVTNPATQP